MALQAVVHDNGYSYRERVRFLDSETIQKSRELFERYRQKGVITAGSYEDRIWVMTDEVHKNISISFLIDEVHFSKNAAYKLGCTWHDYNQAMRVLITSRFGYSLRTLQSDSALLRTFAASTSVPSDYAQAQLIADLLTLLPGSTQYREDLQYKIDDISPLLHTNSQQRQLAHYQSYLRFSQVLSDFWVIATPKEKVLYFPVWFWFSITGILPLRATECVLTPRQCITRINDKYILEVRRTKRKGLQQNVRYSIEQDYERCKYPIPKHLAEQILEYITATDNIYVSDIDVLFCKNTQFELADVRIESNQHYSYANLKQCLFYFYQNIVQEQYAYVVSDSKILDDMEIGMIRLGDMRHIAMVTLAVSGGSPSICKELAGHESIEMSSHYYSNLTQFLDVLGWERYREWQAAPNQAYGLTVSRQYPVSNGYCQCEQIWTGDFSPCVSAVNEDGTPGSCEACRWFFPTQAKMGPQKQLAAKALEKTCLLLRQAIEQMRQGLGYEDTISSVLDRLAAESRQYIHLSAIERMHTESEVQLWENE